MSTYIELLEKDYVRQIEFLNIKKYHELGFKGNGITILNAEGASDHREMTSGNVIKMYAPEATLLESTISTKTTGNTVNYATINLNGETIDLEDAIDKYNIKILTRSFAGSSSNAFLQYLRDLQRRKGIIVFSPSANDPDREGVWARHDTGITVSASKMFEDGSIKVVYYGSKGEVDFTCFMAKGTGSSASSPGLASMTALLLQRYGDFNQEECVEILKSLSLKLPNIEDYKQGWGLPILPLTDKLEILERLRGENMADFKDVEKDRWSKPAIDRCVNEDLLLGFPDNTFRPTEYVTREQFAQILTRILDRMEGR